MDDYGVVGADAINSTSDPNEQINQLLAALAQTNSAPEQNALAQQKAKIAQSMMAPQGTQMAGRVAIRNSPLNIVQNALAANQLGGALKQEQQQAQAQQSGRAAVQAYLAQALRARGQGGGADLQPDLTSMMPDSLPMPAPNY